ncbi:hypothetical protein OBV_12770 [Oscillibacter valericigenes Sjm18-20]|nr:hypothetical protein OBV_12770 [Oscillibacter valericigenes Sjm18-20]
MSGPLFVSAHAAVPVAGLSHGQCLIPAAFEEGGKRPTPRLSFPNKNIFQEELEMRIYS